jgi:hypothetical protein
MHCLETTRPAHGAVMLALTTVALAGTRLATCGDRYRDPAPAIATGENHYTVAWVQPGRHGGSFEVQQFDRQSLKPVSAPRSILRRDDLVAGAVELVAVGDSYLAIGRVEDPEKKPNWATHILTIPLDARGQAAGEQHTFLMDSACPGAGVVGPYVLIAYEHIGRSHRHPDDMLGVLAVDRDGNYRGSWTVASNPITCASAVRGGEIAIVWTRWLDGEPGKHSIGLRVAFQEPRRGGRDERFVVPVGNVDSGPVRIAVLGDDWAILYADPDKRLHVAVVDPHGKLQKVHDLPGTIDSETVDLARNERGLFVTWIGGNRLRFAGIDGTTHAAKAAGHGASEVRALGADTQCVAAWTSRAKEARVAKAGSCP